MNNLLVGNENAKANLTSLSIKFGLIAGLIFMASQIISWTLGITTFVTAISIELFTPYIIILFIVAGIKVVRKQNGGYLSFQEALKFVFLAYVIVALIEAITSYVLYNVLDKDLTLKVVEVTREKTLKFMQKMGASEEQLKESMNKIDAEKKETGFKKIFLGLGISLIWYFVKSMLISIAIKKEQKFDM